MKYTIENEFLKAEVLSLGAELISLISKDDGTECIWQGDEKYWTGHSPIMFPICGRLCQGKYTYRGKTYEMGCHGFARHSEFELIACKDDEITLLLKSDSKTKETYPFDFNFFVCFSLKGRALTVKYKVVNTDTKELIFSVGAHPAFNVPLFGGDFEDYYVEFNRACDAIRLTFSPACLCDKKDPVFAQGGTKRIDLKHDLFDDDAIFLYNTAKKITLATEKSKRSITMYFNDFKYLGLWHKPKSDAPYLCIEPWCGSPDDDGGIGDLEAKRDMIRLPVGYSFSNSYRVEIK